MPTKINLLIDAIFKMHNTGYGHPENSKRIDILQNLIENEYTNKDYVSIYNLDQNQDIDPYIVHKSDYLDYLNKLNLDERTLFLLDEDTVISKDSVEVAFGGLKLMQQGIDLTFQTQKPAFLISRPPGHHAKPDKSMGFCIFNNIAYAAEYAQKKHKVNKVLILDWDAHHFNGTEEIFYNDPNILTISIHQYPHWPQGYGWVDRIGEGEGKGFNLNLPVPKEAGDWQIVQLFQEFVIPKIHNFKPDLILVSAGFDGHILERNSGLGVPNLLAFTEHAYSFMTFQLHQLANIYSKDRIMFALEGGYFLPSLSSGVKSVIDTLVAKNIGRYKSFTYGDEMDHQVWDEYLEAIRKFSIV